MRTALRSFMLLAALAVPALTVTAGPAGGVPDQASDQGEANAGTHGPDPKALDRRGRPAAAAPYDVDAHAAWSASEWDGKTFTTDQTDLRAEPKFHAIYLYPSNAASRFSQFAAMIQADARQASGQLASYGRAVRWDDRAGGYLDITVVRSSSSAQKLGGGSQFNLVRNELISKKFTDPNKKYVVWLDAKSNYCGQGELYQDTRRTAANNNQLRATAIVYRPYATNDPLTGGFCRGRTAMHEMGHTMGALQRIAPHAFDGAHCNDSAEDTMCYTSATSFDSGTPAFDYKNDDYWDPAANPAAGSTATLPWWTVNLSKYVCPTTTC